MVQNTQPISPRTIWSDKQGHLTRDAFQILQALRSKVEGEGGTIGVDDIPLLLTAIAHTTQAVDEQAREIARLSALAYRSQQIPDELSVFAASFYGRASSVDSIEYLEKAQNLADVDSAATSFDNIKQAATTTASGVVELATDAETITGTDTGRALTPSNLAAWMDNGQLAFPATQNASADVNTLDDYEEFTWTPVLNFGGATTGITYSVQGGWGIKIGKLFHLQFQFTLTSKGSATGNATVTGVPFSISAIISSGCCSTIANMTGLNSFPALYGTGTTLTLVHLNAGGTAHAVLDDTNFNNTTTMRGMIVAQAAS